MNVDKLSRIMAMDERDLYGEFTRLLPLRKQRKLLKTLYEWGNSRYFEDVASNIEVRAEAKMQCCIDLHNGYIVRNVKAYIEALCAYIRGNATLTDVMREYRYELVDETSHDGPIEPKPLPAKVEVEGARVLRIK